MSDPIRYGIIGIGMMGSEQPLNLRLLEDAVLTAEVLGSPLHVMVEKPPPVARLVEEVQGGTLGRLRMLAIREHRSPCLNHLDERYDGGLAELGC